MASAFDGINQGLGNLQQALMYRQQMDRQNRMDQQSQQDNALKRSLLQMQMEQAQQQNQLQQGTRNVYQQGADFFDTSGQPSFPMARPGMDRNAFIQQGLYRAGNFEQGNAEADRGLKQKLALAEIAKSMRPEYAIQETADGYAYIPKVPGQGKPQEIKGLTSSKALQAQKEQIEQARKLKKENFDQEDKLRDEFVKQSDPFIKIRDAYSRIDASAREPSAAGDLALIFNYMKMLDPGSVVREGEFATAQNAAGVPQRFVNIYNRLLSGERLAPGQRKDFLGQAENLFRATTGNHNRLKSEYSRLAKQNDLDPSNVIIDLSRVQEAAQQNEPPADVSTLSDDELLNF